MESLKSLLIALLVLCAVFGVALSQFAPDALNQIFHVVGF